MKVTNDYSAKKAVEARDEFKRVNGKDSPDLVAGAAAEVAKAKAPYRANNGIEPQWLKNEAG
jgi:hypothetical protein